MAETLLANRYKIIDKLGEGGIGRVWRVYDTVEQREVALKQFYRKESLDGSKTRKGKGIRLSSISTKSTEASLSFKQEFRTMAKLKHPNTVNVFDYGMLENGDDYITMEIVPGEELRDILKERQLSFLEIYRILIQTSQVLNFIHSRLMVHRDIKPANIRITPEGNVKLMDFGLMNQMGLPSNGEITGTVIYLPPEVAKGGIIDARSDLYSLGVMAYELVTRQPPFIGKKTLDIIRQHIETLPMPPRQIREDIPEGLEEIILKLLAKDQNERYQTTAELINDLVQLTGEKISMETLEQRKSYLNCSELIGREREMQKLKDTFTLTTQGKGQSIFIAAPAGVGKTRLIQEFKLKVQLAEVFFMQGQCFEQGMTAYQPLDDAFKPLLSLTKEEVLDKYGSVLVKVIPELKSKGYQPAPKLDEVGEKVRLFEQVTGWLKEVSRITPMVICIEDLHWSDFATLELLNACIRETRSNPIMILGAFRDDEVEPTSIIFQTVEEKITQLIKLSTLNQDHIQSLIKGMLGRIELTEDFTEHIYTATAGNAFFVSEVMRALIEEEQLRLERGQWLLPIDISTLELPASIEATILRRLKLLSPETLNIARIAAIVGRNLDLSFLKVLSGLEDEKLFEILDELIECQFMKTEEKLYIFTHDRVRETLYNQLDEEKRKELHEKAGVIIEERFGENKEIVASELAYHFSNGLNQQKAVKYLLMAGDQAFDKNVNVEAAKYLREGVDLLENIDYLEKERILVEYWAKLGKSTLFHQPGVCIEYLEKLIQTLHKLVNIPRAIKPIKMFFKVINLLPEGISQKIKNKLNQPRVIASDWKKDYGTIISQLIENECVLTLEYATVGEYNKSLSLAEKTLKYVPDSKSVIKALVIMGRNVALGQQGRFIRAFEETIEAYELFEKNEKNFKCFGPRMERQLWWAYGQVCALMIMSIIWRGKKLPQEYLNRGFSIAEEHNFLDIEGYMYWVQLVRSSLCGILKGFNEYKNKFFNAVTRYGRPSYSVITANTWMAYFYLQCGEFDTATELACKTISLSAQLPEKYFTSYAQIILGLVYFSKGKYEKAIRQLESAISFCRRYKTDRLTMGLYSLGEVFLKMGKIKKAIPLVQEAHQICTSGEFFNEYFQIHTYRLLAQIASEEKYFEKAKEYLEKGLTITQEDENPIEEGLTHLELGRLYGKLMQYSLAEKAFDKSASKFLEINNNYLLSQVKK